MKNNLNNLTKHQRELIESFNSLTEQIEDARKIQLEITSLLKEVNKEIEKLENEEKVGFKVNINKDGIRTFFWSNEKAKFNRIIGELDKGESITIEKV